MKYVVNYKDGRNYDDEIKSQVEITAEKNNRSEINLELSSPQKVKIKFSLSQNEATSIAHALLAASAGGFRIEAKEKAS